MFRGFSWAWGWSPPPRIHFRIIVFIAVAGVLIAGAWVWYAQVTYGRAPVVVGVVVQDLVKKGMHTPVIEYRTPEGARERFKSRLGSYPQKYFVGDKVEVLLVGAERNPMLKDWFGMYGVALVPLGFSAVAALTATVLYFFVLRGRVE